MLCWFLPYLSINHLQVYVCPLPLGNSLAPPSPSCPSRYLCIRLSSLHHTANSHWLYILHMVIYMLQCYSQCVPVSPSPVVCASLSSVSFAALQIGSSVPFFQIPQVCVNIYLFFSFLLTSLVKQTLVLSTSRELTQILRLSKIPLYIYIPKLLYLFTCQWTSRLFPCPGYCNQCCNEHWGTCTFQNCGFLKVYAQQSVC